ncbi:MAG: superoxide dismutase [Elusimicrobia bacterium]|nr:superoxide dismutase [Elusimicrobiota bacterium]
MKFVVMIAFLVNFVMKGDLYAHCQVPCGIFDDEVRFHEMEEDVATIEKAIKQITELSAQNPVNFNQIVRWVQTKETHADEIARTSTQYFLAQRLKPVDEKDAAARAEYLSKLAMLHEIVVYSMKTKQALDLANVDKLRSVIGSFKNAYQSVPNKK